MKVKSAIYVLSLAVLIAGCSGSKSGDESHSEHDGHDHSAHGAEAAEAPAKEATPVVGSGTLALSPQNAKVEFTGAKVVGDHPGEFKAFSGTVEYNGADVTKAKVKVSIETASVVSDSEKLDEHLKSADFFDVEKFPAATFASTGIVRKSGDTYTVTGDFSLHGVTKSISFDAEIKLDGLAVSLNSAFQINRKDYGIVYPGMPDNLIKDEVDIRLQAKGALKAE